MNAPEVKNPRSGFHDLVEMRKVFQERPSLPEVACQVSMLRLAGSRRRSNQIAWKSPDGVASIRGRTGRCGLAGQARWRLGGAQDLGVDQVNPWSRETW